MTPFEKARAAHLPEIVRGLGYKLTPQSGGYGSSFCPKCGHGSEASNKVSIFSSAGAWRWKCFACGCPASSSIDWVVAALEVSAKEAVAFINNGEASPALKDRVASMPDAVAPMSVGDKDTQYEAFAELLAKVIPGLGCEVAVEYLEGRGIPESLTREAHKRRLVYSTSNDPNEAMQYLVAKAGESLMRNAGCIKPGSNWPCIAFRPILFPQWKTGCEFRMTKNPRKGESKSIRQGRLHTPWFWTGEVARRIILVAEGAVDGLSVIRMGWKGHVIALPGAAAWSDDWFPRLSVKYPGFELFVALDNDDAGTGNTRKIIDGCERHGIRARQFSPDGFKDWNDALRAGVSL
ncbi:toprim domain-containing protein [Ferrovum sp.]|uniref:toprim domain-containing protein n=1 Tax=Ferrovum sp. TaxID=2609467 RepID=UPI0026022569|nr:toprim domain-containing protein [Ferrovum sp.]